MTFEEACKRFSDDDTKTNGGYITHAASGANRMNLREMQEMEQSFPEYKNLPFVISRLEVGQVSDPLPMTTNDNKDAFRLVMVKKKVEAHKANLKDDYSLIQGWAQNAKMQTAIMEWVKDKAKKAFIRIDENYADCDFYSEWELK
jgi:peptidyl-prolyl cis-trans isomerase SurA